MSEYTLVSVGVSMGAVIILLLAVTVGFLVAIWRSKWNIRDETITLLNSFRSESAEHYTETLALLKATREFAATARDNRIDTAAKVEEVKAALTESPSRMDLAAKIDEVPEKTAKAINGNGGSHT